MRCLMFFLARLSMSANAAVVIVAGSYLVLYTGYDKPKQRFDIIVNRLRTVLTFQNVGNSLVELNKVAGLTVMTLWNMATVAILASDNCRYAYAVAQRFADRALLLLVLSHGPFSIWKYSSRFDAPTQTSKRIGMYLGPLATVALTLFAGWVPCGLSLLPEAVRNAIFEASMCVPFPIMFALTSAVGTAHVYFMERAPGKKTVAMRPFGTLGLAVSGLVSAAAAVIAVKRCALSR